jgi:hypothetical protein
LILRVQYTQHSTKKETYQKTFRAKRLDFLIFMPVNHIYRFLRKEDDSKQLEPIANFLNDIGINEENVISFVNEIKQAFSKKADTKYVLL